MLPLGDDGVYTDSPPPGIEGSTTLTPRRGCKRDPAVRSDPAGLIFLWLFLTTTAASFLLPVPPPAEEGPNVDTSTLPFLPALLLLVCFADSASSFALTFPFFPAAFSGVLDRPCASLPATIAADSADVVTTTVFRDFEGGRPRPFFGGEAAAERWVSAFASARPLPTSLELALTETDVDAATATSTTWLSAPLDTPGPRESAVDPAVDTTDDEEEDGGPDGVVCFFFPLPFGRPRGLGFGASSPLAMLTDLKCLFYFDCRILQTYGQPLSHLTTTAHSSVDLSLILALDGSYTQ